MQAAWGLVQFGWILIRCSPGESFVTLWGLVAVHVRVRVCCAYTHVGMCMCIDAVQIISLFPIFLYPWDIFFPSISLLKYICSVVTSMWHISPVESFVDFNFLHCWMLSPDPIHSIFYTCKKLYNYANTNLASFTTSSNHHNNYKCN